MVTADAAALTPLAMLATLDRQLSRTRHRRRGDWPTTMIVIGQPRPVEPPLYPRAAMRVARQLETTSWPRPSLLAVRRARRAGAEPLHDAAVIQRDSSGGTRGPAARRRMPQAKGDAGCVLVANAVAGDYAPPMQRVAIVTPGVYLALAVLGHARERSGSTTCECGTDCWCKSPGLNVFRWLFPFGHSFGC